LRTYLLMMTSRRAIDIYRSEQARGRRQDRFSAGTDPSALATADPEDSLVASEDAALVRGALDALPLEERAAIDLAYFGHHSYREVAQLLGKPEGTIKSRIRTGLGRLRSTPDLQRAFAS
jgi:RNA polymerase sigma-70 factor (ECF subfamily)